MKRIIPVLIVSLSLISCSISEQIIFNADGSGKLSYTVDMSKMIEITKDLDKKSTKSVTKDMLDDTDKDKDTLISFKDLPAKFKKEGKEITAEQLANIEKMKDFSMRIVMNKSRSEAKYILSTDFKNIADVSSVGSMMSALQTASGKNTDALGAAAGDTNSDIKFTINGKKFTRVVEEKPYIEEIIDEEVYDMEELDSTSAESYEEEVVEELKDSESNEEITDEEVSADDVEMTEEDMKKMQEEFKKMGEMMEKGLKESSYNFQYTFAKKIKKVSLPKSSYKLSDDKKTIFITYQLEEFNKKIKNLNLDIEFE